MAHDPNISTRMTLLCALALSAGAGLSRAADAVLANPLRATEILPHHAPSTNPAQPLAIVEYGPAEAQDAESRQDQTHATTPEPANPPSPAHAPRTPENKPLGEHRAANRAGSNKDATPLRRDTGDAAQAPNTELGMANGATRTLAALAAVVGLILIVRWFVRRMSLRVGGLAGQLGAGGRAPSGVMEVLGRYPVGKGQSLVLLRLDRRVLLLSQSAQGFAALTEIDDPQEVASLVVKTADDESASLAARFKSILSSFERDPSLAGDVENVDPQGPTTLRLARQRRAEVIDVTEPERGARVSPVTSVRRRLALLRAEEEEAA